MALIEREVLLAAYDATHKGPPGGARKLIEEAPAVDAAPVVHGRWVKTPGSAWPIGDCSICGEMYIGTHDAKFCPICGAKMDGSEG